MTATPLEQEVTFEGAGPLDAGRLDALPEVSQVAEAPREELDAVYDDTADLRLLSRPRPRGAGRRSAPARDGTDGTSGARARRPDRRPGGRALRRGAPLGGRVAGPVLLLRAARRPRRAARPAPAASGQEPPAGGDAPAQGRRAEPPPPLALDEDRGRRPRGPAAGQGAASGPQSRPQGAALRGGRTALCRQEGEQVPQARQGGAGGARRAPGRRRGPGRTSRPRRARPPGGERTPTVTAASMPSRNAVPPMRSTALRRRGAGCARTEEGAWPVPGSRTTGPRASAPPARGGGGRWGRRRAGAAGGGGSDSKGTSERSGPR
ncbi:hypothetical protein SAMN05216223_118133 [Actinacidiphila yanglinensis]|uniref:Uncharacterized protein n=1 Tax=Actinacidiphila yanglinensis TaxID=310779 RepID=A0A1H6DSQ2_9ACTN|nr:hypothetical protein SAMN05216223_118133 [Actinacidiphila yanglinensis]